MIKLAKDLFLPIDVVTQTMGVVAKKRSGKSYFARRLAEQLHKAGQQVVIVDPKGDWWGLLSAADGKGPGLPFVIIGGERGHVPLEASGGEVVAKLVAEERVSALLDLSLLRKHEIATFMAVFLEQLYRLKAHERLRTPVMLLIDEADAVAPQKPQPNEARMLGAAEDIVRRGGQRGIGCTMITQRTAVLNKNILTQCQVLIALRTISPQDLAAMNAWIDVHGTPEQRKTLMNSLPALPVGDAWVWSPGWPTDAGIFQRIHTLPIETFDSGATPKPGQKRVEPKRMADVDLDAVRAQMAATIERAKADDPKTLRARVAELEKELAAARKGAAPSQDLVAENQALRARWAALSQAARELWFVARDGRNVRLVLTDQAKGVLDEVDQALLGVDARPADRAKASVPGPGAIIDARRERTTAALAAPRTATNSTPANGLTGPEQRILDAIAWLEGIGVQEPEQTAVAFLAGYTIGGGAFNNPRGRLRTAGLVEYAGKCIKLTEAGRAAARQPEALLSTKELHAHVLARLDGPERRLLEPLLNAHPKAMTNEALAAAAGYTAGAGAFNNPRGRLRTLGLVEYPAAGQVRARDILFVGGDRG